MISVLVVEDEAHLADGLRFNLEAEGYEVDVAGDGETALQLLGSQPLKYSAVVLDVMLPGVDGFTVASSLRQNGQFVPIMMLTARGRPEDVLKGFESGADDYLPKPFELAILVARLHSLIRRSRWEEERLRREAPESLEEGAGAEAQGPENQVEQDEFTFEGKTIDFGSLELRTTERVVRLTLMETELLRYLVAHAGVVVSRKSMLQEVWNLHVDTDTRAIDNFIVRLRRYIEDDPARPRHLLTVRGVGYRFFPNPI
jgi:DNA-binding response OmpR family regulator